MSQNETTCVMCGEKYDSRTPHELHQPVCIENLKRQLDASRAKQKDLNRRAQEAEAAFGGWKKLSALTKDQRTGRFIPAMMRFALTRAEQDYDAVAAAFKELDPIGQAPGPICERAREVISKHGEPDDGFQMECRKIYCRREDMSPDGRLTLFMEDDGDVIVEVQQYYDTWSTNKLENPRIAQVQFCTLRGGGSSLRTRRALVNLVEAMVEDQKERPQQDPYA